MGLVARNWCSTFVAWSNDIESNVWKRWNRTRSTINSYWCSTMQDNEGICHVCQLYSIRQAKRGWPLSMPSIESVVQILEWILLLRFMHNTLIRMFNYFSLDLTFNSVYLSIKMLQCLRLLVSDAWTCNVCYVFIFFYFWFNWNIIWQ